MTMVFFIVFILALINVYAEYKRTLMMLQQNSYRNERYMKWLRVSGDSTSGVRLFAMIVMLLSLWRMHCLADCLTDLERFL